MSLLRVCVLHTKCNTPHPRHLPPLSPPAPVPSFSFALSQSLQLLPRRLQPHLLICTVGTAPVPVQTQKAEVVPLLLVGAHFKIQSVFWRLHATLAFAQSWVVLFLNI